MVSNSFKKQPSTANSIYYKLFIKKGTKRFQLNPYNVEILEKLVEAKLKGKKYQKALTYLDILIELCPQSFKYHFWRGLANFNLDNYQEAAYDYTMAIQ